MPVTLSIKIALVARLALLAALGLVALAPAEARFDPASGRGYTSRPDILSLFKVAPKYGLAFSYTRTLLLSQECMRQAGRSMTEYQTRKGSLAFEQGLEYGLHLRRRGQVAGYRLEGYAGSERPPALPADLCPADGDNPAVGKWVPAGPIQIAGSAPGQLRVTYREVTRTLIYTLGEE